MTKVQGRWLVAIALGAPLLAGGLWWARPSADPIKRGLDAYAHGDWEAAAGLARTRLLAASDDNAALQLLARSSVRLGRDSWAMAIYQRLGLQAMSTEDLCLVGIALTRTGNRKGGLEVWEEARTADPNHAETLFELTRAYSAADQLSKATETGQRLASRPGWKARAESLLGTIQLAATIRPVPSHTGNRLWGTKRWSRGVVPLR